MTEVLRISPSPEPPFTSSSIRRATSHTSLILNSQPFGRSGTTPPNGRSGSTYNNTETTAHRSSSAPISPRVSSSELSSNCSTTSTPLSSLSLQESSSTEDEDDEEPFGFPIYDHKTPSPSGTLNGSSTPTTTKATSPPPPPPTPTSTWERSARQVRKSVGDDTAVKREPSRHVDYLSHNWIEEDIWSSWKHIIGKRRAIDKWERLENASWRAWAKSRSKLQTVAPEKVNWMKDHDVTWLYGPLQSNDSPKLKAASPTVDTRIKRTASFGLKKSCLKKRSLSEAMLQRSLSSSTLVQQAVDSLVSQRPSTHRNSDSGVPSFIHHCRPIPSSTPSDTPSDVTSLDSTSTSGAQTPCAVRCQKRHIHFSDNVEQCIAIDAHDGDYDINHDGDDEAKQADDEEMAAFSAIQEEDEGDFSDDGIIMMKPEHSKERKLSCTRRPSSSSVGTTPRNSFSGSEASLSAPSISANKTIAMLPSTRLKYRGDTPEPPEFARSPTPSLVPSASQETLKPARPSSNFLLDDEDEDVSWQPSASASSATASPFRSNDIGFLVEDEEAEMRTRGLRKTASGMFMPYDESADGDGASSLAPGSGGIFGRVVDTVNTARDIAHVIWNVGLRG